MLALLFPEIRVKKPSTSRFSPLLSLVKKNQQQTKSRGYKPSSFSTMFVQFPYLNPQALEKYREGSYMTSSTQNWVSTSERQRSVHWNDPVTLTAAMGHQTSQISGHGANPGTGSWSQQHFWSRGEQTFHIHKKRDSLQQHFSAGSP